MTKILFSLIFFLIINDCFSQAYVREVEFDWKTKIFNNNLPFDVPFQIRITHLTKEIKGLRVRLLESERGYKAFGNIRGDKSDKLFIDSNYYNTLPGQDLGFYYSDTVNVITVKLKIKPNVHYLMNFYVPEKKPLDNDEKEKLKESLKSSSNFQSELLSKLQNTPFTTISQTDVNPILYKYIKKMNPHYELDTANMRTMKANLLQGLYIADLTNKQGNIVEQLAKLQVILEDNKSLFLKPELIKVTNNLINHDADGNIHLVNKSLQTIYSEFKTIVENLTVALKVPTNKNDSLIVRNIKDEIKATDIYIRDTQKGISKNYNQWMENELPNVLALYTYSIILVNSSEPSTLEAKANSYISQSVGLGYSSSTGNFLSTLTYSFFFRPVNQDLALSEYGGNDWWKVRLCLNAGITIENISSNKIGQVGGIVGNKGLLLGGGFRLLSFLKLDLNGVFYTINNPNPLNNHKRVVCSFLPSLSLNLNVSKILSGQHNSISDFQNLIK